MFVFQQRFYKSSLHEEYDVDYFDEVFLQFSEQDFDFILPEQIADFRAAMEREAAARRQMPPQTPEPKQSTPKPLTPAPPPKQEPMVSDADRAAFRRRYKISQAVLDSLTEAQRVYYDRLPNFMQLKDALKLQEV